MKLRIPAPGQEDEGIPDLLLVILATCAFLVILLVGYDILDIVTVFEERELAGRFGATYERYRDRVPRFLPRLRP